jgi:hypothetical protein
VATTSEGVKSVVETMLKESVDSAKGNSPGYTDISSDQLKEFINFLEHTTPSPLTPAVKTADLWAWMGEPANMAMLGVMFLCGMNEICCSRYYSLNSVVESIFLITVTSKNKICSQNN